MAPFEIYHDINMEWPKYSFLFLTKEKFQLYTCRMHTFTYYLNFHATSWFLAVMAFDRFLAVNKAISQYSTRLRKNDTTYRNGARFGPSSVWFRGTSKTLRVVIK